MIIPASIAEIALNDQYFDLKGLSSYASMGVSTLRYHIRENGLPWFKITGRKDQTGKILVKRSEFDTWIERFRANDFINPLLSLLHQSFLRQSLPLPSQLFQLCAYGVGTLWIF